MVSQWCHYPHWKYLLRFHFLIAVSHYLAFVSISVIQTTKWFSCFLWDRRCSSSGEILFIKEQRQIRGFVKVNLSIAIVGAVSQPFSPVKMIQPKICQKLIQLWLALSIPHMAKPELQQWMPTDLSLSIPHTWKNRSHSNGHLLTWVWWGMNLTNLSQEKQKSSRCNWMSQVNFFVPACAEPCFNVHSAKEEISCWERLPS